jgi:hypothetical protein
MAPVVLANFDVSKCTAGDVTNASTVTYTCPTKSGAEMQFVFTIVQQDDTYRISRYDITDGASDDKKS